MSRTNPTRETHRLTARRDHYRCLRCGNELDHIWSGHSLHHRHMRSHPFPGLHSPANLIHLCGSGTTGCHGWVHNHPKTAMAYGWIVSGYNDHPETVPVWRGSMTFEQTNEKQRQRMKADARSHMEAARMILASPLYARLKGGEDLYTAVWALWESLAGTGLSNMKAGAVCHACKTHDLDQLDWALTSIAKTGSIRPSSTPAKHPLHCTNCGKECRPHAGTPILCSQCKENLRRRKTKQDERKTKP